MPGKGPDQDPISTSEADAPVTCRKCGETNPPESAICRNPRCRGALPANQLAREFPKVDTEDPAIRQQLAEETARHIADRGGREEFSTAMIRLCERTAVAGLFVESWERFFMQAQERGGAGISIFTKHGRVRSGYQQGYLATLDRYMRLAQLIGLDRRPRKVESPLEWLERRAAERDQTDISDISDSPSPGVEDGSLDTNTER